MRHDWQLAEVQAIYQQPLLDLVYQAHAIHRENWDPNKIQVSTLLSIKTGACPEDCAYCAQSGHHNANLKKEKLLELDAVLAKARQAQANGASRFCMGAAWRSPTAKGLPQVVAMIKAVKALGLETCATLGMLTESQAATLKAAGLDYYNHNLDTSREYYPQITTTRTYQDRLDTLQAVRKAGIKVCCGGIIGMGEDLVDRLNLLRELANFPEHPESVPINKLARVPGTPLGDAADLPSFEWIRTIAVARCLLPKSFIRLSAGRNTLSREAQVLCMYSGANSIFYGEKLLTVGNPTKNSDEQLFADLGLEKIASAEA